MKKILLFLVAFIALIGIVAPALGTAKAEGFSPVKAKSACLIDKRTGELLYGQREDDEFPIASMVKIMTALITFEEIEKGNLSFDEKITVSDTAAGMGGSQMFLDRGFEYPVTDLLKGVIVVSANDACVALAERIAGAEETFVAKMNERAKELGMTHTVFVNATGLPKEGGHSTARDVAAMLRELTKHGRYYDYSKIWLEDYTHPDGRVTTLTNTNKFVRFYEECDGGKTGFTSEAKFCLAASAHRGDTALISVVIGAEDGKTRFAESKRLLSYGFASYKTEVMVKKGDPVFRCPIKGGCVEEISAAASEDLSVLRKAGATAEDAEVKTVFYDVKAPVKKGDTVGECTVTEGGKTYTVKLIAAEDAKRAGIGDSFRKISKRWN
ncbi:MAG: D-alanyl-D-alanine carboxypeptidase [Clostridia bacterium]|nr:D-alanyl-D-alanine carboxypeptidase [Clostridia bacterium]